MSGAAYSSTCTLKMTKMLRMKVFQALVSAVGVLLCLTDGFSQQRRPPHPPQIASPLMITTFSGVSAEEGKAKLDIMYRIPKNFFVFVRDSDSNTPDGYIARCELSIEILGHDMSSVARDFRKHQILSDTPTVEPDDTSSIGGIFSFDLFPGDYSVAFEVTDPETKRSLRNDSTKVAVRPLATDSVDVSDILLISPVKSDRSRTFSPLNYGGAIPFGRQGDFYCQISWPDTQRLPSVVYSISRVDRENEERQIVLRDSLPPGSLRPAAALQIQRGANGFHYDETDNRLPHTLSARWHIDADTLEQGTYAMELTVRAGSDVKTVNHSFTIRWIGMPSSLGFFPMAISAMQHVLGEEEFKTLKSAAAQKQRKLFTEYWKKRDATPRTAYNEVMEEYLRRVDHAARTFGTLRDENGIKSDRGKAYILYGPPTTIERKLLPAGPPQEIWIYANLQKRLTFADPSRSGDYRLLRAEEL